MRRQPLVNYAYRHTTGTEAANLAEDKGHLEEKVPETGAQSSVEPFSSASFTASGPPKS